jgi:6-phospho-beta-glucosidase
MKFTVIGGCGTRAPQLVKSALRRCGLNGLTELWLMDIDFDRRNLIGELCQQIAVLEASPVKVFVTDDAQAALDGSDYIVTTIRVGGDTGRILDEKIALRNGVLGQETTGAGGFAMAMRTIPCLLRYAALAEKYAPQAWLFNFTNPAGLVTQALHKSGFVHSVGICDSANHAQHDAARWFNLPLHQVQSEVFGLNHLSWASRITVNGRDVLPELLANPAFRLESNLRIFDPELLELIKLFPNEYLYYYYYSEQAMMQIQQDSKTRGEEILELNQSLLKELASIGVRHNPEAALGVYSAYEKRRSGTYMHYAVPHHDNLDQSEQSQSQEPNAPAEEDEGYAGLTMDVITALQNGGALETALNIPNRGAICGIADDDIVEVSARIFDKKIHPIHIGNIPDQPARLIQAVKLCEQRQLMPFYSIQAGWLFRH